MCAVPVVVSLIISAIVAYDPAPSVTRPMTNANKQAAPIARFSFAKGLPLRRRRYHITAGIQNEKPETNKAEARAKRSEKMGIASAMTQAMIVKMQTRTIQDAHPATVLMYFSTEFLNMRPWI